MLDTLLRDMQHALRMFVQSPAFALAAVAALTLGIAVNTAIFSVVNAVLLRPLPFPDADRIVFFMNVSPQGSGPAASPAKFQHYREQTQVVEAVSAFNHGHRQLHRRQLPRAAAVGPRLGGVLPAVRRADHPGPHLHAGGGPARRREVVVLSKGLWADALQQRSRRSSARRCRLAARPHTDHRRARRLRLPRLRRPAAAGVGAVPARSEHHRPGPLLSGRRAG